MRDRAVGRGELPDAAWDRLECLLPKADGRGRPWRDHRQVINGVLWRLRTALHGATCRNATDRGRRCTSGSRAGKRTAHGLVCWKQSRRVTTRPECWSGRCRWTPPSTVPTSMPPEPAKGGIGTGRTGRCIAFNAWPGARQVTRRVDHEGAPRGRRPRPASGHRRDPRQCQRLHGIRHGAGSSASASPVCRTAPPQARDGHRRQGVLVTGHTGGHPRTIRPDRQPATPRSGRRSAAILRPRAVQGPQRGRTMLQQAQAVPSCG